MESGVCGELSHVGVQKPHFMIRRLHQNMAPDLAKAIHYTLVTRNLGLTPKPHSEKSWSELQGVWLAESNWQAHAAFDLFAHTNGATYERSVAKLITDHDEFRAFHDFPYEHWKHFRTTKFVESEVTTNEIGTRNTMGCHSGKTALVIVVCG